MTVDFSELLHELRGRELRRLPVGANVILHGGASGSWYFHWFDEHYRGDVERHIGVEAFAAEPADLPANVAWLPRTLGDIGPVPDATVDMVFAGQVIEHLWPEDVAGLLLESHRVLRSDGLLVLDSPNRRVTEAIGWCHPQHTAEFTIDEAVELVRLAGFDVHETRGLLRAYDSERHAFLGIDTSGRRPDDGATPPEDAFIWWMTATRAERAPDADALGDYAARCFDAYRCGRLERRQTSVPVARPRGRPAKVAAAAGHCGPLVYGPYFPVDAGAWRATFAVRLPPSRAPAGSAVAWLDAVSDAGTTVHASRDVRAADLTRDGSWGEVSLDFSLAAMVMGVELRACSYGTAPLEVRLGVRLDRVEEAPGSIRPASVFAPAPQTSTLRIRHLARLLVGRTAEAAAFRIRRLRRR